MVNLSDTLSQTFSALGDPTRRAIIRRLAHGPATVSELGRPLPMSAPAVSKHLRVLERAGLIERRREGRVHWCRIRPRPLMDALSWIEQQRGIWEGLLDSLEAYLEGMRLDSGNAESVNADPERESQETKHGDNPRGT